MHRSLMLGILFVLLFSCTQKNMVFSEYRSINNGSWKMKDTLNFSFSDFDSIKKHNIYINVRNDGEYPFSNLLLIAEMDLPSGETILDTLEYEMAMPDGKWLGKGLGGVKESKLWYRENIMFKDTGQYNLKVSHAMRRNGEVDGLAELKGLTDLGIEIELSN